MLKPFLVWHDINGIVVREKKIQRKPFIGHTFDETYFLF